MRTLAQTDGSTSGHIYDIYLDDGGDFVFSSGKAAHGNIIASAIRTLEGELQLDTSMGIPYQRTIWERTSKLNIWEVYVRETIERFPFVKSILGITTSVDSANELHYVLTVETDIGTVEITQ